MPWNTPTLRDVRTLVRDAIRSSLPGADANIPNSVLRVLSDNQGALCHLTLQYIDWLSLQLLPDTAETEWLDRHGKIWLVNADGSTGRKIATTAYGTAEFTAEINGTVVPMGSTLETASGIGYEVLENVSVAVAVPSIGKIRALDPGIGGNLPKGSAMALSPPIAGVNSSVFVQELTGGVDTETDEQLRARVLRRIRQPPMGGAAYDYEAWALACPGVTRAWCAPLEMGIGTVTVRFVMDDLRADNDGIPNADDIAMVETYINTKRPVAVKDFFVVAPIKQPINFVIDNLVPDTELVRAGIEESVRGMLRVVSAPGQTIFAAWKNFAIMSTPGIESFRMVNDEDDVMESQGHMAVLGDIVYE